MRHVIEITEPQSTVPASSMKIGEYAIIVDDSVDPDYNGNVVLRAHTHLVSITSPEHTWDNIYSVTLQVRILPVGTKLSLTVGTPDDVIREAARKKLRESGLIDAIKKVRELTNMGLKEAKDFVENVRDEDREAESYAF